MRRIALLVVAVVIVAGVVVCMVPHLATLMERTPQSSEAKSPPDTATGR